MIGKSKEYFDLWESDKDHTDPSKSYEELLAKVKDYSRRKKLDNSAKEKMQHGGDPMDVGTVGGWTWQDDAREIFKNGGWWFSIAWLSSYYIVFKKTKSTPQLPSSQWG